MRFLITGATGFIGGELTRQLRRAGHDVVALVRSLSNAEPLNHLGVDLHVGDIRNKDSLRRPMAGVDGVFHVAAWYKLGVREPAAEAINVDGTRNVLEVMRERRVPRGVYTSTLAVFSDTKGQLVDESYRHNGPFLSTYDRTKWRAHYEVALPMMADGLPLTIVMPGLVYGPGDTSGVRTMIRQYLQGKLPAIPGRTAFCWAHVEDAARGHVLAMEQGKQGEIYIIAGPPHTMVQAFELAASVTGLLAPRTIPPGVLRGAAAVMSLVEPFVTLPSGYASESLRVLSGVTYLGSNAKARRELGYDPRPLEVGWRETIEHERRLST